MSRAVARCMVVAALVAGVAACGDGSEAADIRDGRPRFPDDEGVATELTTASITLDGERTYEVSERLAAFDTYTRQLEPMLGREGQYVQIGLEGDTMVWMAGIGSVLEIDPPSAYYVGDLATVEERDGERFAVFVDGTVLRLADGLQVPSEEGRRQARIDVERHAVIELGPTLRGGAGDG